MDLSKMYNAFRKLFILWNKVGHCMTNAVKKRFSYLNRDLKLIFIFNFLSGSGAGLILPILPLYVRKLGGGSQEISFVFSVGLILWGISVFLGGIIADRFERKKIIILHWLVSSPTFFICFLAQSWEFILLGYALYNASGIGASGVDSYVSSSIEKKEVIRAFTTLESAYYVPPVIFSLIAAYLVPITGMRDLFGIAFIICLFGGFSVLFISPQEPERKEQMRKKISAGYIDSLKNKAFLSLIPLFFFIGLGSAIFIPFLTPLLEDVYLLSLSAILVLNAIKAAGLGIWSLGFGQIGDHLGVGKALVINLLLVSVSMLLLAFDVPILSLYFIIFIFGGISVLSYLCQGLIGVYFREKGFLGSMYSIFTLSFSIGGSIGAFLGGIFYDKSPSLPAIIGALLLFCLIPVVICLIRRINSED